MPRQFSLQSLFHFVFKHSPLPIPVSMSWPSPWLLGSVTCGNFEMGHSKSNSSKLRTISATGLAGSLHIRFRLMSATHLSCSVFDRSWCRWANTKRFGSLLRLVIKSTRYWGLTTTKSLISELWFSAVISFPGGRSLKKKPTDKDIIINSRWLALCYRPIQKRSLGVTPLFGVDWYVPLNRVWFSGTRVLRDSVPIMRTRERHLFFLQKTIELSYWLDKISFRTTPPTEICCLYSQAIL